MSNKANIYPSFESRIECIDSFKDFIQGNKYRIEGFGTDKRNEKKVDVWYIKNLNGEESVFTVIKSSINVLIDSGVLKIDYV